MTDVGYGRMETKGESPRYQNEIKLKVAKTYKSGKAYFMETSVDKKTMFGPCSGDSGGPLLIKTRQGEWEVVATLQGGGYNCKTGKHKGNDNWSRVWGLDI